MFIVRKTVLAFVHQTRIIIITRSDDEGVGFMNCDRAQKNYRIAIDVGGTFTDVVIVNTGTGELWFAKVLSTPEDPSIGSLNGAVEILEQTAFPVSHIQDVVHATTVATNAVLERRGAITALITTKGFSDVIEIGREARYDIYDFNLRIPEPLVPRRLRLEAQERVNFSGHVIERLDMDSCAITLSDFFSTNMNVTSAAVCLLHSYVNSEHESRIAQFLSRKFPYISLSVSSQVANEAREYERMSTTVIDAYVKPLVSKYILKLEAGLQAIGFDGPLSIMLSHGGIGSAADVATRYPVRMIESGPAAGAIAAGYFAEKTLERPDALAFDMGGTTAKISVIRNGHPTVASEYEVGHVHRFKKGSGLPLQISAVELLEIGAGGGSIAHLNDLGLLAVGPMSAGAFPGPACYGKGGVEPTVTDANLVLGYLDPQHFLGGDMKLSIKSSRNAIDSALSNSLNLKTEEIAWGIHDLVNEKMAAATRAHATTLGVDLRDHAMVSFGGSGPVHSFALAQKLGMKRIICPFGAGVASSIGCLVAPPAIDTVRAFAQNLEDTDWSELERHFDEMLLEGSDALKAMTSDEDQPQLIRSMDIRCAGQGYSVTVPFSIKSNPSDTLNSIRSIFSSTYNETYGHIPPNVPLEIINLRARIHLAGTITDLHLTPQRGGGSALKAERSVYFEAGGFRSTAVYDRYRLKKEKVYFGPAVIEERETTTIVGPDSTFYVDRYGHLNIEL